MILVRWLDPRLSWETRLDVNGMSFILSASLLATV